jgi:vancomycin resistance protein YoaR
MTTTTDTLQPEPESTGRSLGLRFLVAFAFGVLLVGALAAGGIYAFEQRYDGRILPGVRAGGLDVSGLTPAEARVLISQAYASVGDGRIVVDGPDSERAISYAQIGRRPAVDGLVAAALATGHDGGQIDQAISAARTLLRGVDLGRPEVAFDEALLSAHLDAIARPLRRGPIDATVVTGASGFVAKPSRDGRAVDDADAREALVTSLSSLDAPSEIRVELAVRPVVPAITNADAALAKARADRIAQGVVLAVGEGRWAIDAETVRTWIGFTVVPDGQLEPTVDRAAIVAAVEPLAKKIDRAPKDASFLIGKNDQIVGVRPGVDGRTLDPIATADRIATALTLRAAPDSGAPPVEPVLAVTAPEVTTEEATAVAPTMSRISTWTTYYPIGEKNGFGANIEIPTRLIDGTVVAPGAEFDFWDAIGTISRENGYKQGGAIINGRTEPQGALAGGICSCSTTIFNTALRAGLEMGARQNHYYYIDRYPLGLDATVFISASGSKQTMSFTNDTSYPVLIRGYITHKGTRGYVRFDMWSVPTGRTVTFSTPIVKNRKPATTVTEETDTLPAGTKKRVEYPVEGKDVWVTRTVQDAAGNVVHEETYYSHYSRVTGVILVGTHGATASPAPGTSTPPTASPTVDPTPEPSPSPAP